MWRVVEYTVGSAWERENPEERTKDARVIRSGLARRTVRWRFIVWLNNRWIGRGHGWHEVYRFERV